MDHPDFDGTTVLESLAAIGKVDEFYEAIDGDDVARAISLMKRANVDRTTIRIVVQKIEDADVEH